MAIWNTTTKPIFLIPLLALVTMLLMLPKGVKSANSVSFSFNKFGSDQKDMIFQGDATSRNNVLELTKVDSGGLPVGGSVGRVLYSAPLRLWESSTVVSSFDTTFTFAISSPDTIPGDGLAFFIASHDSQIPPNSGGRLLGLFPDANALKNSSSSSNNKDITMDFKAASDKVVAVEFDTYPNTDIGDPNYKHIGIDVNSIRSKANASWDWQNGKTATAHITYNSASKRLTVVTFYPGTEPLTLSYDTQLNTVLPEWVRVGFSASTGLHKQTNTILSWSFTSTLKNNMIDDMYIATVV